VKTPKTNSTTKAESIAKREIFKTLVLLTNMDISSYFMELLTITSMGKKFKKLSVEEIFSNFLFLLKN